MPLDPNAIGSNGNGNGNTDVSGGLIAIAASSLDGKTTQEVSKYPASLMGKVIDSPNALVYLASKNASDLLKPKKGQTKKDHCQSLFKDVWHYTGVPRGCKSDVTVLPVSPSFPACLCSLAYDGD